MRSAVRKGFTLIELLIVVVIIGILAAVAIPKFSNTKEKAYLSNMRTDVKNLVTVQESFFGDNQRYATTLAELQAAPYGFRFSDSTVTATLAGTGTPAGATGWRVEATAPRAPGPKNQCAAYGGAGLGGIIPAGTPEGAVVCP